MFLFLRLWSAGYLFVAKPWLYLKSSGGVDTDFYHYGFSVVLTQKVRLPAPAANQQPGDPPANAGDFPPFHL